MAEIKENNPEDTVKDPVCGMIKPKNQMKAQFVYKGIVYYFCSGGDKDMFIAHPDHWIKKVNNLAFCFSI